MNNKLLSIASWKCWVKPCFGWVSGVLLPLPVMVCVKSACCCRWARCYLDRCRPQTCGCRLQPLHSTSVLLGFIPASASWLKSTLKGRTLRLLSSAGESWVNSSSSLPSAATAAFVGVRGWKQWLAAQSSSPPPPHCCFSFFPSHSLQFSNRQILKKN